MGLEDLESGAYAQAGGAWYTTRRGDPGLGLYAWRAFKRDEVIGTYSGRSLGEFDADDAEGIDAGAAYELLYDPQTAGGLLAAVPGDRAAACVAALREGGDLHAAVVGEVLSAHDASAFPAAVEINL